MLFMSSLFFLCSGSTPPSSSNTEAAALLESRSNSGSSQDDLQNDLEKTAIISDNLLPVLYYEQINTIKDLARRQASATEYDKFAILYAMENIMYESDPILERKADLLRSNLNLEGFEEFRSNMEDQNPGIGWTVRLDNLISQRKSVDEFDTFLRDMEKHLEDAPVTSRRLIERVCRHMGDTKQANRIHQEIEQIYQELRVVVTQ